MGLWDKLKGELVDIVEWLDSSHDTMVYRFQRYQNEIKYGAQLIVRESQVAVFVNEGQLADVFLPGTYTLETQNLPILSTLRGWKFGFNSPFKAEVYFVSTRTFTDRKWGTKNPVMLRDPEFGPVRLRAFGTFAVRVKDAGAFIRQIVGTNSRFTVDEIGDQLRDLLISRFADVLGESKLPVLDMASNYDEMGKFITGRIQPDFERFGLDIVMVLVENVSLPPEVEQALDKRTSMGVIGNMQAYTQFQAANAITDAAKTPGGLAGAGVGMGMGLAMGGQVAQTLGAGAQAGGPAVPPPLPGAVSFYLGLDGKQAGPFDQPGLQAQVAAGRLTAGTLAWKAGMAQWAPAAQIPELAAMLASVPPPLPGNTGK
ncbi:MAG: SPFH domain-containing protein [Phycisphaerae bacterium]|nr:SPFH domain-containing protein [Phycisphaerae bacterium]